MADTEPNLQEECSPDNWAKEWETSHGQGFHLPTINGMLKKYIPRMTKDKSCLKFLFPFCGKDICMKWLTDQGHTVVGCDCAPQAFEDFTKEQNLEFTKETVDDFTLHKSKDGRLKMYCGNFYNFSEKYEGLFDIIWDRGGFNAVNASEQSKYKDLTTSLMAPACQYYLINFDMEDAEESKKVGNLTDDVIKSFFDNQKYELELRSEFVPADYYNGDLCKGMEGWKEKLTIITLKQ